MVINSKLPISAIVVGYNEAKFLNVSLPRLNFCDEIIYFDLGSKDKSIEVAINNGAKVINHKRVPGCEWIHAEHYKNTKHNWVLITDPDEVLSRDLVTEIESLFLSEKLLTKDIGCLTSPLIYHFKDKPLKGTIWGGIASRILLIHNERFNFKPLVHLGRELKSGYSNYSISFNGKNNINHYWMVGYGKLFEKHIRYLKNEGEARYSKGYRISFMSLLLKPLRAFQLSFMHEKGYKDGITGLFLSLFWAWYDTIASTKLYLYQRSSEK